MPKLEGIKRVLVIGSGPIIIGQAAEFDYAGTQACRSLKEEGMEVILVNSNPATIMTDKDIADKVYIEPLTVEVLEHIIEVEKPDSLLPNMGGQAGLNLGMELAESGFLESPPILHGYVQYHRRNHPRCTPDEEPPDNRSFQQTQHRLQYFPPIQMVHKAHRYAPSYP